MIAVDIFRFLDELVQNGLAPIGLQRDAICGVPSRGSLDLTDLINDPAALDGAARCDTHSLLLNSADRLVLQVLLGRVFQREIAH